jgi:hypothetical protein
LASTAPAHDEAYVPGWLELSAAVEHVGAVVRLLDVPPFTKPE